MNLFRRFRSLLSTRSKTAQRPIRRKLRFELLEDRVTPSVNPIVTENLLPGTPASVWDVGNGDPTIQGFATDISVDNGSTINFKVNDNLLVPYHIDIYRLGYYAGLGAPKVATISSSQTLRISQPSPITNASIGLVDCGNWQVTASWAVPAAAVSGVYLANAVRDDTGGGSQMVFIVRDDDSHSDLLFQTSDTTWQAYNSWGGNSFYTGSPAGRAYALSYNRPFNTRTGGTKQDYLFNSEYPMIRWLESNGYNVSYFTDVDSDRLGSEILEHQVFMSVGHDEYWSGQQRANVEAARNAGVNLAFFSGNEVYWKTRWDTSIDGSGTAYRTLVCYKETWGNAKIDPSPEWTGTWRDPRFSPPADGGRPENALTGTIFTVNKGPGGDTGTSFTVPAEFAPMRFWRNTVVANLQAGQTATLGDQVLGYEWDEDLDNGFRPAGLITLSSTTQNVPEKLLDYGNTVGPGTATHSLTLYRASSGALVFGAGTVQWGWGLDSWHDGLASVPDQNIKQATVNLFAEMGVQPATLQAGLLLGVRSSDAAAPASVITNLTAGQQLTAGAPITITGTAADAGGGVVAAVEVSVDGGYTWHRATGRTSWTYSWTPSQIGPVVVQTRAVDDSVNVETPATSVSVTVNPTPTSSTGLVGAYSFNGGIGSIVNDASSQANNGSFSGASSPTWTLGKLGMGLSFDGNDLITIPDAASLHLSTGMTLEAWVNPTALSNFGTVILKERPGGLAYSLYSADGANNPPSTYLVNTGGSDVSAIGTSVLPVNTWSHLSSTYDGSMLRLYVNGQLVRSQSMSGNIFSSTNPLRIGGNAIWGEYFQGIIDEVRIYNRALNQAEIVTDMSTAIGGMVEAVAPSATITSPSNGASVAGVVNVNVNATDNVSVGGVQLLVDGQPVGTEDTISPYTIAWTTTAFPNGSHVLTARVRDMAGNSSTSAGVSVTVSNAADTVAPTVKVLYPTANIRMAGTFVANATASDNVGVVGVKFRLNGVDVGAEDTSAPYSAALNTLAFADGSYNLVAVARDAAGNVTTSAAVPVIVDNTAPTITARTPAPNATLVSFSTDVTATFAEDILSGGSAFTLRDASNNVVPSVITYDSATRTLILDPVLDLGFGATYTASISGVKDLAGNVFAGTTTWTFTTSFQVVNASLWDDNPTPAVTSANDPNGIELGLKFQADINGYVTGVRFYKGAANTGTHVGHLWDANGNLVASATFTNESAAGWQQVNFSTPVAITANATYVVSYFAPSGGYAVDGAYFAASGFDNGRLHALPNSSGGNGLYRYTTTGIFPSSSFNASNYWVDVIFSNVLTDITAPTVLSQSPGSNATGVATTSTVNATFSEPVQSGTISFVLRDAGNNVVASAVNYNSATRIVTLTPNAALAQSSTYTATLSGALDLAGNSMQSISWSFTTTGPDLTAPTVLSKTPAAGATGVAPSTSILATFSESVQFSTISFVLKDASNAVVAASVHYDSATNTATLTPGAGEDGGGVAITLYPSTTYTVTLSGVKDLAGNTMQSVSWSFTTDAAVTNKSFWNDLTTPAAASVNDLTAVELGMKFQSTKAGYIIGLRFYKGSVNTGTHVGHLWDTHGNLLSSATFVNETATGWQQVSLPAPVLIAADTTYVVSYYAPNGGYAANGAYFTSDNTNAPLVGLASGSSGGNGLYRYGTGGGFPTSSFNSSNYWVDVVFTNTIADLVPPTVTAQSPGPNVTGVGINNSVSVKFSEAVQASSISLVLKDNANNTIPSTVNYDANTHVATLIPTSPLSFSTAYTVTVSGATDFYGNTMVTPVTWSFTTGTFVTNAMIWNNSVLPAVTSAADTAAVELGLKFTSDTTGWITGLRFYKGTSNTGTHVGHLWDANGNLLTTATFTGESGSGWQQVNLTVPVAVTANSTYIVSYYAPNGGYSYTHGYFTNGFTNSPLRAMANGENGGNGLYRYGTGGGFPTNSYLSTNYWVDVVFTNNLGDTTPPTITSKTPAAGATGVVPNTGISVTFSESVQPSTIAFTLRDINNNFVTGTLTYVDGTQTATFVPANNLLALTNYTATLSGALDIAGNPMPPVFWSFTTKGTWVQSSVSDFASGTTNGVVIRSGGGLQLASSFEDQFAGASLGSSWSTTSWASQGGGTLNVGVSAGVLSVQGAMVATVATYPGIGVEGVVSFAANPYQHFGVATNLDNDIGNYWAIFSTGGRNDTLYARVNSSGNNQDVNLGALPSGFHTYKVLPITGGFQFYVDDVLKTTINLAFPAGTGVKIVSSSYNGGAALQVDRVTVANYTATGTFKSSIFDAGAVVTWQKVSWNGTTPTNTSINVEIMVSNDSLNWSNWTAVTNGTTLSGVTGRYIRYRITLTTTDATITPILSDISLDFA